MARFFHPAWAVTAATAGFLVGFTMAGIVRLVTVIGGFFIGCSVFVFRTFKPAKS
jgi:hypothetical protein